MPIKKKHLPKSPKSSGRLHTINESQTVNVNSAPSAASSQRKQILKTDSVLSGCRGCNSCGMHAHDARNNSLKVDEGWADILDFQHQIALNEK